MQLDTRTFFVVLVITCLIFAASSAFAVAGRFRHGMGKWSIALLVQALMFVLYGLRGFWPESAGIILPNALYALALALQAAAILEFYERRLSASWLVFPPLLVGGAFFFALDDLPLRVMISGFVFGGALLAVSLLVHRIAPPERNGRWMLMVGYLLGSATFVLRGIVVAVDPGALRGFLAPTPLQFVSLSVALIVLMLTSIGFILLHLERAEASAQQLAVIDPLTGVFNRRTFLEIGDREIARALRTHTPLSLAMIDVDHFKPLNDKYGHLAGDEVLRRVVLAIKSVLRREDLLVRYGGEEFCILVPGAGVDQATLLAERAREAVQKLRIEYRNDVLTVTISAGVAALRRSADEKIEDVVNRADEVLYEAKRGGRNRVVAMPEITTIALLARAHGGMREPEPPASD